MGRLLAVLFAAFFLSASTGCSVMLSQIGPPRCGPPEMPYVHANRAEFEKAENGWGTPVACVVYEGHEYKEYTHYVHAPRDYTNPFAYWFFFLMTLGVSEVVTTPIELVRLSGITDYNQHVRVEWDEDGALVAWMLYWNGAWGPEHPSGWLERETVIPRYIWERRARAAGEHKTNADSQGATTGEPDPAK